MRELLEFSVLDFVEELLENGINLSSCTILRFITLKGLWLGWMENGVDLLEDFILNPLSIFGSILRNSSLIWHIILYSQKR
jgi:hypothetical protein